MKKTILSLLLISLSGSLAAGTPVPMTANQREAFAIQITPIEKVQAAISAAYPAEVVVPNAQLRVVSAPQGGLLEALLVSEGETVEAGQPLAQIQSPQLLEQQGAYLEAMYHWKNWAPPPPVPWCVVIRSVQRSSLSGAWCMAPTRGCW